METSREARILIVDDHREIARTLRTMLELTERGYFVVDVPSGEEALLEIRRVEFDVLVADYRLAGMNGLELIERVQEIQPGINTILISAYDLDDMWRQIQALSIRQVFAKPVDADRFVSAVRELLGDHAGFAEAWPEAAGASEPEVQVVHHPPAPTPIVDNNALVWELSSLVVSLGAQGALLISPEGGVMLQEGLLYDTEGMERLGAEIGPVLAALPYVCAELGEAEGPSVHYYGGKQRDVYLLSPSGAFGLALIFPGGSQREMGAVLRYGRPAVETIRRVLAGSLPADERTPWLAPPAEDLTVSPLDDTPVAEATPVEDETGTLEPLPDLAEEPEDLFALPETEPFDAFDFDPDEFAAELDAASLKDLDSFWEEAAALQGKINEDALSLDEARELGLLGTDEDSDLSS